MAVALIQDFPDGTMRQYREVVARMDLGGRMPSGGRFHAAGVTADGLRVVDVWDDLATFERFRDAQIVPNTRAVGLDAPSVRVIDVHQDKPGSDATPVLVQVVRLPGLDAERFAAMDARVL